MPPNALFAVGLLVAIAAVILAAVASGQLDDVIDEGFDFYDGE